MGITEKTVKFHRGHIMQKMQSDSLADLARIAERLQLPSQKFLIPLLKA
jgi:FixJ family two-component response regulator